MKLNELPDAVKQRRYRGWTPFQEYGWWDSVYEYQKERGKERGMCIEDIYFSGFASQGDGACWKGHFFLDEYLAWEETQEVKQFDDREMLLLRTGLDNDLLYRRVGVTAKGMYSHSSTMEVSEVELERSGYEDEDEISSGPLAGMQVVEFVAQLEAALGEIDKKILKICRDFADEIYKSLEEEDEHLHSMESFEREHEDTEFNEEGEEV